MATRAKRASDVLIVAKVMSIQLTVDDSREMVKSLVLVAMKLCGDDRHTELRETVCLIYWLDTPGPFWNGILKSSLLLTFVSNSALFSRKTYHPSGWIPTIMPSKNAITIKQPSWELCIPDVWLSLWLGRTSYAGRAQHRSQVWLETYELQLMKRTN